MTLGLPDGLRYPVSSSRTTTSPLTVGKPKVPYLERFAGFPKSSVGGLFSGQSLQRCHDSVTRLDTMCFACKLLETLRISILLPKNRNFARERPNGRKVRGSANRCNDYSSPFKMPPSRSIICDISSASCRSRYRSAGCASPSGLMSVLISASFIAASIWVKSPSNFVSRI